MERYRTTPIHEPLHVLMNRQAGKTRTILQRHSEIIEEEAKRLQLDPSLTREEKIEAIVENEVKLAVAYFRQRWGYSLPGALYDIGDSVRVKAGYHKGRAFHVFSCELHNGKYRYQAPSFHRYYEDELEAAPDCD